MYIYIYIHDERKRESRRMGSLSQKFRGMVSQCVYKMSQNNNPIYFSQFSSLNIRKKKKKYNNSTNLKNK